MNNLTRIKEIYHLIDDNRLGAALRHFQELLCDRVFVHLTDRFEKVKGDYQLLLDYMSQYYDDPSRQKLYAQLLAKMYQINTDAHLAWNIRNVMSYSVAAQKCSKTDTTSDADIRLKLENYVVDMAMLDFIEEEGQRRLKEDSLCKEHADFTDWLFNYVLVADAWNSDRTRFFQDLVLAPTVDTADAALVVAAVSLSCMNIFDPNKWTMLTEVYRQAANEKVKQRALVGWVLALPKNGNGAQQVEKQLKNLLLDNEVCIDLFQLQRQIFLCMNAEKDTKQIQEDIMPGIIKNNNLNITRFGITEQEEDPLRDILDPDADDRAMEEVEESIQRMMEMQKAGADIYFGGFSMMKRFGFFYQTENWFRMFDYRHPALSHVRTKLKDSALLEKLVENGPFCDSDKFSFALGLASVIDRLPEEYRSMLGQAEAFGPIEMTQVVKSPAYVRRMYLQDLYRFFKLAQDRKYFKNPFHDDCVLFFAHPVIASLMPAERTTMLAAFLLKQQRYTQLGQLLEGMDGEKAGKDFFLLKGSWLMHAKQFAKAAQCLEKSARMNVDDKEVTALLAKAYYQDEDYDKAEKVYQKLVDMQPDNVTYVLYAAMCALKLNHAPQAVEMLYPCLFSHENDTRVKRVLAWALMADAKPEKAERFYDELLADGNKISADDYLNAAYCKWMLKQVRLAADLLCRYLDTMKVEGLEKRNTTLYEALMADRIILTNNGIPQQDILAMTDLVTGFS